MKLFYKPGACSMAAHIVLNEAGADYSIEKVDTGAGVTESGRKYSDINPRGYVPALEISPGDVLTENVAILQWLSDTQTLPGSESVSDQRGRSRQLELLSFLSSELHKAFGPFFSGKEMTDAERSAATSKLATKIGQFDRLLTRGGDFLLGDTFRVVDAYAFVILNWTNFIGVSLSDWPTVQTYFNKIAARPATQKTLAEEGLAA